MNVKKRCYKYKIILSKNLVFIIPSGFRIKKKILNNNFVYGKLTNFYFKYKIKCCT